MTTKHSKSILWDYVFDKSNLRERTSKVKFLKKIPFFDGLSFWQVNQILQIMYEREFSPSEYVFEQGQAGAALFIVFEGQVAIEILDESGKAPLRIAELGSGAFFGEMALIDGSPRSASALATKPTKTFAFFRKDLEQLHKSHPEIASRIFQTLASVLAIRLKLTNDQLGQREAA